MPKPKQKEISTKVKWIQTKNIDQRLNDQSVLISNLLAAPNIIQSLKDSEQTVLSIEADFQELIKLMPSDKANKIYQNVKTPPKIDKVLSSIKDSYRYLEGTKKTIDNMSNFHLGSHCRFCRIIHTF